MTPGQTWLLISIGITTVMLAAWWITHLLEGRDPHPHGPGAVRATRCECGRYLFLDHHTHRFLDGDGTVHRPDLCQPADEAL